MIPITEDSLKAAGYSKQIFFYKIGGGEDEDDIDIFVKDNIAVSFNFYKETWYAVSYSSLIDQGRFRFDDAEKVTFIEDIKL